MTQQLRREVRIPIYWLVFGILVVISSPFFSIITSVNIAEDNARDTAARQAATQATAAAASRVVVCAWFAAWLDLYDEDPPTTERQRKVQVKTLELYQLTGCQPPRK